MATEPKLVTVRMYNVGFGDCFLLSFCYEPELRDQHILIDFGSVGGGDLSKIAAEIQKDCHGKLYAVVATHRHRDHINGFAGKPGAIIASCKPEIVLQPWTEDPEAAATAKFPSGMYFQSLNAMQAYAGTIAGVASQWRGPGGRTIGL